MSSWSRPRHRETDQESIARSDSGELIYFEPNKVLKFKIVSMELILESMWLDN